MNWQAYLTWTNLGWFTLAAPVLLWLIFVPLYWILGREKTQGSISSSLRAIAIALFLVGAPIDVWVNLTWGTALFLQRPSLDRGFLSARMDYILKNGSTGWAWVVRWRKWLAIQIVGRFLEPFDKTGQHTTYGLYALSKR